MYTSTGFGVPSYQAVELFDESGIYTKSVDIWALGCILYEMIHYNQLFTTKARGRLWGLRLMEKVRKHEHQPINESCPEIKDLILKCINPEPTTRPKILELLDQSIDLKMTLGDADSGRPVGVEENERVEDSG